MILEVPIQEHLQMTSNGKSFRREAMIWRPPFIWLEIDVNYLKFMLRVFWSAVVPKQQKKDEEFFLGDISFQQEPFQHICVL